MSKPINKIRFEELLDYIDSRKADLKQSSLYQHVLCIRIFFNWCQKRGYCKQSPSEGLTVRKPQDVPVESLAFEPETLRRILNRAKYTSKRDYALLLLMITTGIRIGGAASLCFSHMRLDCRDQRGNYAQADVLLKGKRRWMPIYIAGIAYDALLEYLKVRPESPADQVWLAIRSPFAPLSAAGIGDRVHALALAENASHSNAHAIRHAFGHGLASVGVPVTAIQRLMGHSSENSTAIYMPKHQDYIREIALSFANSASAYYNEESDTYTFTG